MDYFIICLTALAVSALTLVSGFGLSTLLMPVFAIFFPLPVAIASTAVVHLANNLFKIFLVGKWANLKIVMLFGIPAAIAAIVGAYLLGIFSHRPPLLTYHLLHQEFHMSWVGVIVGSIVVLASLFEFFNVLSQLSFNPLYVPLGGILSGFFGGLSGNQGMLRSSFLIKATSSKEEFIGTSVLCSVIVDVIRLVVYGWIFYASHFHTALSAESWALVVAASLTAFLGSYLGAIYTPKITYRSFKTIIGIMLLTLGAAMIIGVI